MEKISIYGTGKVADYFMQEHDFSDEEIVEFIETNPTLSMYKGIKLVSVENMNDKVDKIYLANSYIDTLNALLVKRIERSKIVVCNTKLWREYSYANMESGGVTYDKTMAEKYEKMYGCKCVITFPMKYMNEVQTSFDNGLNVVNIDFEDYCRYTTLELLLEQVKDNNIKGELAELGVFRGDFSKYINASFPDRKLYLFDTFEGFDEKDISADIKNNYTSEKWFKECNNFSSTSMKIVLDKMKYQSQCVVRKGWFPETIPDEEITYAFVSLDCDLYEPMLAGLRYFYPRLSHGGYMMLHDYNLTHELRGVKQAVRDYELEIGEKLVKVPVSDVSGSLVIGK